MLPGQSSLATLVLDLSGPLGSGSTFSFLLSTKKEEFSDFPPGEG